MKRYISHLIINLFQKIRILIYHILSTNKNIIGKPIIKQPAQFTGSGTISFGKNTQIGYFPSPYFYSGYTYLETRNIDAKISIGSKVFINNNFVCIAEKEITIGNDVLIGTHVEITDSDFHCIVPSKRSDGSHLIAAVRIENNVWLGSNVKILKGVTIGENSVITNGAIVTKDIPANVVAGGVPAKVIKSIENDKS